MKKIYSLFILLLFSSTMFAGTGGPDIFGYTWKDSNEPGGPAFQWRDIISVAGASQVKLLGDDNSRGPFFMNFNFHYYWYDVNQFWVGSNGYIEFHDGQIASNPFFPSFPNPALPNDVLGVLLNDFTFLNANNPAQCWYYLNPALDTLIVSWEDVPFFDIVAEGYSGTNSFQIILSAVDSSITYQYLHADQFNPVQLIQSSVGMENYAAVPGAGLQWPLAATIQTPPDSFAIKFYYPHPPLLTSVTDAAVLQNDNPSTGGVFVVTNGDPYPLTTKVRNYSTHSVDSFDVYGKVVTPGGATFLEENFYTDSLLSAQSQDITYNSAFVPTTAGTYKFITLTELPNDPNASGNNSKKLEIVALDSTQTEMWLGYDGGAINGLFGLNWVGGSGGAGNYYAPPFYPVAITKLHYWITSYAATDAFIAKVYDDDGVQGLPFTLFDSLYVPSSNIVLNGWTDLTLASPIIINNGGFYVSWDEVGPTIVLGCAQSDPFSNRGFEEFENIWGIYRYRETQDLMIAATIEKYSYPTGVVTPIDNAISLSVFPNPAHDQVNMLYSTGDSKVNNELHITDLHGKMLQSILLGKGSGTLQKSFDVSSLPQGIYFVTLWNGKQNTVQKLVITR